MDRLKINPSRELTPFEELVLSLVCEGKSNSAIALHTSHSEKVIENTVSRSAHVYGITSGGATNLRVMLALAYRAHYGDKPLNDLNLPCLHHDVGSGENGECLGHS